MDLGDIGISDDELRGFRRVLVVACGTSYHAGVVARYAIEEWSGVPVGVDIASEFRYRKPLFDERDLVIGITQSGETADTLAAMRLARECGAKVLAITNVMGSQATRDADGVLFTRAGLEIGRGRHQDLRRPDRGDVPARPQARRRCAAPSSPRCMQSWSPTCARCRARCRSCSRP